MNANDANNTNKSKLIYPELSYLITGVLFNVHNELGPYAGEKQYGDKIEQKLKQIKLPPIKENSPLATPVILWTFYIEGRVALELKTKRILTKEDYFQMQRYLQEGQIKLGLLVNFRNKFIKPVRIIRIEKNY